MVIWFTLSGPSWIPAPLRDKSMEVSQASEIGVGGALNGHPVHTYLVHPSNRTGNLSADVDLLECSKPLSHAHG